MRVHVVADAMRQRAFGREGTDERAHDGGRHVVGMAFHLGRYAHRLGSPDDAPRQSGGAHDACDGAGGRRPQAARHGDARVDVDGDGEGLFSPVLEREDERAVDEVVLVAVLLGTARDGQLVRAIEGEAGIEAYGHAEAIVSDAEVCRGCRHGNDHAHSSSPHFFST